MTEIEIAPPTAEAAPLSPEDNRYAICAKADRIQGWLEPQAARRSVDILRWQDAQGITGNLLEIGVFCGRYFSILLHGAMRQGDMVLGVDTFQFSKPERVAQEMREALGEAAVDRMKLQRCNSLELTAHSVHAAIGTPRFISLDGAHDVGTVHTDLELAAAVIATDGMVAVNDVLNPLSPGVNEAVNRFLMQPRRLVPVAFIGNKLFLANRARAGRTRDALEDMIRAGGDPAAQAFALRAEGGRHHVQQPFHGYPVLIS